MARKETEIEAPAVEGQVAQKWYVVLHNAVGRWFQGQSISDQHLADAGHDPKRLLELGAIAEAGSDEHREAARDGLATVTPDGTPVDQDVPLPSELTPQAGETSS